MLTVVQTKSEKLLSTLTVILYIQQYVDYRSSTIRKKRWPPELEQKIKNAFNVIKTETEGVQYLMQLGLTAHEIDLVLQHFFRNGAMASTPARRDLNANNSNSSRSGIPFARVPLSAQEQQLKLIAFSKNVSRMLCGLIVYALELVYDGIPSNLGIWPTVYKQQKELNLFGYMIECYDSTENHLLLNSAPIYLFVFNLFASIVCLDTDSPIQSRGA